MSTFNNLRLPHISNCQSRHRTNKLKELLKKSKWIEEKLITQSVKTKHKEINLVKDHLKAAMRGRMKWFRNKNHTNSIMRALKNNRTMLWKRKNRYLCLTFSCSKTSFEMEILQLTTKIKRMRVKVQRTNLQRNKKSNRPYLTNLDRNFKATKGLQHLRGVFQNHRNQRSNKRTQCLLWVRISNRCLTWPKQLIPLYRIQPPTTHLLLSKSVLIWTF